jgi:pimeloyl-ACP methyl ester carboxylesterase
VSAGGYRIEDHVGDMEAIVTSARLERVHLVTYSRGTSYGLAWAFRHAEQVASITIGDYPAAQIVPPTTFAETMSSRRWRRRPITDRMPREAIDAMVADAVSIEFWDDLRAIDRPVLLIRGGAPGAMVDATMEERYRRAVPDLRVVGFDESGHDLWSPDPQRFPATVCAFLDEVEASPIRVDR